MSNSPYSYVLQQMLSRNPIGLCGHVSGCFAAAALMGWLSLVNELALLAGTAAICRFSLLKLF